MSTLGPIHTPSLEAGSATVQYNATEGKQVVNFETLVAQQPSNLANAILIKGADVSVGNGATGQLQLDPAVALVGFTANGGANQWTANVSGIYVVAFKADLLGAVAETGLATMRIFVNGVEETFFNYRFEVALTGDQARTVQLTTLRVSLTAGQTIDFRVTNAMATGALTVRNPSATINLITQV